MGSVRNASPAGPPRGPALAPAKQTDSDIQAALDAGVGDSLVPVAFGLGVLYGLFAASHLLVLPPPTARVMACVAGASAMLLLSLAARLRRRPVPARWAHPLAAAIAGVSLTNALLHLALTAEPWQTTNLLLVIIGAGLFFLSTPWLALVLAAAILGWGGSAWHAGPSSLWMHYGFGLLGACTLSILAHTVRVESARRLERLRRQDEWHRSELEAALAEVSRSEERLRRLAEVSFEGIAIHREGRILDANHTLGGMLGYPPDRLLGTSLSELVVPAERESVAARLQAGGDLLFEVTAQRGDGTTFPAEVSGKRIPYQEGSAQVAAIRDITERKKADRLKSEFVSTVSHELRTPLTSIRGSLGLLAGGVLGPLPDKAQELVAIAQSNSERLVRLITELLDLQKIEAGRMEMRRDALDMSALVAQAVEANRDYARHYEVSFALSGLAEGALVRGDGDRLTQVVTNLLSNAAKFSPEGATVEVEVACVDGWVRTSVADHGPGIPEEFRDRVFQQFAQADATDSRRRGGTGLGLSISRAIVERLGGSIRFETQTGVGTTFFFDLPRVPPVEEGFPE